MARHARAVWERAACLWRYAGAPQQPFAAQRLLGARWLLYGATGCRITYLATHSYSCTPATTLAYLRQLHERYGYPVWLTEFSCGDGAKRKTGSAM